MGSYQSVINVVGKWESDKSQICIYELCAVLRCILGKVASKQYGYPI